MQRAGEALGQCGAVLEAVPRAPADEPDTGMLGMRGGDEVGVRSRLVAAGAGLDERCDGERGKALREVRADDTLGRRVVGQVCVRVELRPFVVRRGLRPELVEVRGAVHRTVVVAPAGDAAPFRAAVEEEQLLKGDPQRTMLGKQPREPGPAGPDHCVALEEGPVLKRCRPTGRSRASAHDPRAVLDRLAGQRLHRALRAQHPGAWLEEHPGEVVRAETGEQPGGGGRVEVLAGNALGPDRVLGLGLPAVLAVCEPRDAAFDEEVGSGLRLELAPERAGAPGHRRVVRLATVPDAEEAGLAARGRAPVAGLELIDERDVVALAGEPPGERCAEYPRPHDDHAHGPRPYPWAS